MSRNAVHLSTRDQCILGCTILLLFGLNVIRWSSNHAVFTQQQLTMISRTLPHTIGGWQGHDLPHTPDELGVLGDVSLIKREYKNPHQQVIWLIAQQTPSVEKLHNVYVSLIASGAEPVVTGQKTVATSQGPLRVTVITLQGTHREPYQGYLWYQWVDRQNRKHNAPNRWAWYRDVLRCRFRQEVPEWRLVEIITPAVSADLLNGFARTLYELPEN